MGDPKKIRKKYEKPRHPWIKEGIEEGKILVKEYGLKNKKELWKAESFLRKIKRQAKLLINKPRKEQEEFVFRLARLGLIEAGGSAGDMLDTDVKKILERRLQMQVYKTGMARTIDQARQFVVHGHIMVNNKKLTVPSYLLHRDDCLQFCSSSTLNNPEHPERVQIVKKKIGEVKKEEEIEISGEKE
ncbi:30S ribosomal protein S4 [archaeon]|nr:30S ribosomal protein S4 [archaeon]